MANNVTSKIRLARKGRSLDLSNCHLQTIPEEVFELKDLETLYLMHNRLTELPAAIGRLTRLQNLFLSHNQLRALPPEIGQLRDLYALTLYKNALATLPAEIGQCQKLIHIAAAANAIRTLPPEIGHLTNLRELRFAENQLSELPETLGELTNLEILLLNDNRIRVLPESLRRLTRLRTLQLERNRLAIPRDVLTLKPQDSIEEILLTQVSDQPFYEAKVLFVGDSNNGKTTMIDYLVHDCCTRENLGTTHGIEQTTLTFERGDVKVQANVWDLGGQHYMRSTHQFFFSQSTLYVLVVQARREGEDLTEWMRMIRVLGGDAPVIVVGSKADHDDRPLNEIGIQRDYPQVARFVYTRTDQPQTITVELRRVIEEVLYDEARMPEVFSRRSKAWHAVRQVVAERRSRQDYLTFRDLKGLVKTLDDPVDEGTLLRILELLHKTGVILKFGGGDSAHPELNNMHILNPEWVTTGVYAILTDSGLARHNGRFTTGDVARILSNRKLGGRFGVETYGFLVGLLRYFQLCYPLSGAGVEGEYLMPMLFTDVEPTPPTEWEENDVLRLRYTYRNFVPEQIMPRFIVLTHAHIHSDLRWRTGVYLKFPSGLGKIYASQRDSSIFLEVGGPHTNREGYMRHLEVILDALHAQYEGIEVEKAIWFKVDTRGAWIDVRDITAHREMRKRKMTVTPLRMDVPISEILQTYPPLAEEPRVEELANLTQLTQVTVNVHKVEAMALSDNNFSDKKLLSAAIQTGAEAKMSEKKGDTNITIHGPVGNVSSGDHNTLTAQFAAPAFVPVERWVGRLQDSAEFDRFVRIVRETRVLSEDQIDALETQVHAVNNPAVTPEKRVTLMDRIGRTLMPILTGAGGNLLSEYLQRLSGG